jgi:hypothetical protein
MGAFRGPLNSKNYRRHAAETVLLQSVTVDVEPFCMLSLEVDLREPARGWASTDAVWDTVGTRLQRGEVKSFAIV